MRHLTRVALAVGTTLALASVAGAQTVVANPGTPYNAPSLTGFATTGSMMGGMSVTGFTAGGGAFSGTWADLGGGNWGVSTAAFTLSLPSNGDTFGASWTLAASGGDQIVGLRFSGAPGGTVFDRAVAASTDGSENGFDFAWVGGDMWRTLVTYTNVVGIGGAAPVGDIYEQVDVTFGVAFTQSAAFRMDTDNITPGTRLTPVPEPSTVVLMASGLIAVAAMGRRRLFRGSGATA